MRLEKCSGALKKKSKNVCPETQIGRLNVVANSWEGLAATVSKSKDTWRIAFYFISFFLLS